MPGSFDLSNVFGISDLPKYLKRVEECMDGALADEHSRMGKAVLRLTRARGKRLRPALVIASALLSGTQVNERVIRAAAAVELIHIGSLVHDDIIDEADTRWSIPTINASEGQDYAVLGGDFLFAKACALATAASQDAGVLAAETIADLCSGQSAELATQYDMKRTEAQLMNAISGKTSALMSAACALGGICAEVSEDKKHALMRFGSEFGTGFQLVDDVLDFVSTDELMGKPVGNDIKEGVYTLPVILALRGNEQASVENELVKPGSNAKLADILLQAGSIAETISLAEHHNQTARETLESAFGKTAQKLATLPETYLDWALSILVAPRYRGKITRVA